MARINVWKLCWVFALSVGCNVNIFADTVTNPCGGASMLLNIVNRPTVSDSACVVPLKDVVIEAGYQYQKLTHSGGVQQNFPQAQFRLGLPANNEFTVLLPNYIHQSKNSGSGLTATTVGLKHEIGYTQTWLGTVEALITLPSGSEAYGSKGTGAAFNGIVNYTFNPLFGLSFMLGVTSETESSLNGGGRFTSINPDLVLSYSATEKLLLYGEIYGQSKTGPSEGSGFNSDAGVIYLLTPKMTVDLEIGQRISGNLNGFNHYVGGGFSVMF